MFALTWRRVLPLAAIAAVAPLAVPGAGASGPQPGTPEYFQRDVQNIADAFGRQTQQQFTPDYVQAQLSASNWLEQIQEQGSRPTRLALGPGSYFPGWNEGNPYRSDWNGRFGEEIAVSFTNRYGALLQGHVFKPLGGATDPYTGQPLQAPFPAVVITTGSVQGSEGMYIWLAEDLAERGYVVLTYDVQGQGRSESLPHQSNSDLPYCDPTGAPAAGEQSGCPGVPSQQTANFVYGTEDALNFLLSTPSQPYPNPGAASATVNGFNPFWADIDRSSDANTVTPGRTTKVAIIGHSLGATAVSYVQAIDARVETVVALDKLSSNPGFTAQGPAQPVVPALAIQSEYGFEPQPYFTANCSSFSPCQGSPDQAPNPAREELTGFKAWAKSGVDTMLVVPRASTHLEYTDISYALPASRDGQDMASYYVQWWLDKYLKHDAAADDKLLSSSISYMEPAPNNTRANVTLARDDHLSFYFCSGYDFRRADGTPVTSWDIGGNLGCAAP